MTKKVKIVLLIVLIFLIGLAIPLTVGQEKTLIKLLNFIMLGCRQSL